VSTAVQLKYRVCVGSSLASPSASPPAKVTGPHRSSALASLSMSKSTGEHRSPGDDVQDRLEAESSGPVATVGTIGAVLSIAKPASWGGPSADLRPASGTRAADPRPQ
jgi:hypothetical protein